MSYQSWQQTLATAPVAGAALSASTTQTSILPPGSRQNLPGGFFNIGTQLKIIATGAMSTAASAPGNVTFFVTLGSIATPINVFNGSALALATSITNAGFWLEVLLTCRAVGNGTLANLMGQGNFTCRALFGSPLLGVQQGIPTAMMPDTAPAVGTGFDSTAINTVDLQAQFSVNSASNSITLHQYMLESLN